MAKDNIFTLLDRREDKEVNKELANDVATFLKNWSEEVDEYGDVDGAVIVFTTADGQVVYAAGGREVNTHADVNWLLDLAKNAVFKGDE